MSESSKSPSGLQSVLIILLLGAFVVLLVVAGQGGGDASAEAHDDHTPVVSAPRPELTSASPVPLDPSLGREIGAVYQAFLSPHQQGGEEADTPSFIPSQFRSTKESVPRDQRPSHGHASLAFTNDLSRAYVYLQVEGVILEDVVMMHLHCGRPGQLGPIIIDFGRAGNVAEYMADGSLAIEITNADIEAVLAESDGLIGLFTAGCPIVPALPTDKVKNIAGLEYIAREGDLYFNLHTAGQTYFGDIRGRFTPVTVAVAPSAD
ncbi:MAG: CHRD domain-containing protein [Anaerolineae bacterium]|nr:CHRD domain-containing protein [Anaerolineae bacterium]